MWLGVSCYMSNPADCNCHDQILRSGFSGFSTDTDRAVRDDIWNAGLAYFLTVPREGDNGTVRVALYCTALPSKEKPFRGMPQLILSLSSSKFKGSMCTCAWIFSQYKGWKESHAMGRVSLLSTIHRKGGIEYNGEPVYNGEGSLPSMGKGNLIWFIGGPQHNWNIAWVCRMSLSSMQSGSLCTMGSHSCYNY